MAKLKDLVTGPFEAGECNEICPGLEHCVIDMRLPYYAGKVAYAPSMELAQKVADALNFYHNFAQAAADDFDFTTVPERGLPTVSSQQHRCQCGDYRRTDYVHRLYSPCRPKD